MFILAAVWLHADNKHYRCDVYCESADGEILRKSERVPLSLCGCEKKSIKTNKQKTNNRVPRE